MIEITGYRCEARLRGLTQAAQAAFAISASGFNRSVAACLTFAALLIASGGLAACLPEKPPPPTADAAAKLKLGFDPATVHPEHKGKRGEPGLPAGFSFKPLVERHKYDDPDVIALDPTEKYLYFITHLMYPDGSVYRIDLTSGEVIRLSTGLQRPGGIFYYQPTKVLIVAEEGTGAGPQERQQGFMRIVKPDVPDQPTPPPVRAMGQYRGEGIEFVPPDTIYITEDLPQGGHIYKYVLSSPPDPAQGTLYTLKENEGFLKTAFLEAPDTGKEGTKYYAAEGLRMGPDGKLYAAISAEAETRVISIEPATGKVKDFVTKRGAKAATFDRIDQITFNPQGVLFITAGGEVFAALPDSNGDGASDGVYRFLTGMDVVQGMQFTKDGSTLYLAARGEADQVLAITGFTYQ